MAEKTQLPCSPQPLGSLCSALKEMMLCWTFPLLSTRSAMPSKRGDLSGLLKSQFLYGADKAEMRCPLFTPSSESVASKQSLILPIHTANWTLVSGIKSEKWYRDRCFSSRSSEDARMMTKHIGNLDTERKKGCNLSVLIQSSSRGPQWFYISVIHKLRYWGESNKDLRALRILLGQQPGSKNQRITCQSNDIPLLPYILGVTEQLGGLF